MSIIKHLSLAVLFACGISLSHASADEPDLQAIPVGLPQAMRAHLDQDLVKLQQQLGDLRKRKADFLAKHGAGVPENAPDARAVAAEQAALEKATNDYAAAAKKYNEDVQLEAELQLDFGPSIQKAAEEGDLARVRALLAAHPTSVDATDDKGRTPLYNAADSGHLDVVKLLLEKGATVDVRTKEEGPYDNHITPLMAAAGRGHLDVVKLLLEKGAAVDARGRNGSTPLSFAAEDGHAEVAKLLLEKGAAVDPRGSEDSTPLYFAALFGHFDVVKLLLEKGAAVDARRGDGSTPLMEAAWDGHLEVVKLLLEKGAAVDAMRDDGIRPLLLAAKAGHFEVVKLLLEKGAAVNNAKDSQDPQVLLYYAIEGGDPAVVILLLEKGADPNAKLWGYTPLEAAKKAGHAEIAAVLRTYGAK